MKNKLIEMARAYWKEYVDHIDHIINGKSFSDHMADFAQHVLDKQWTRTEERLPSEPGRYILQLRNSEVFSYYYFRKDDIEYFQTLQDSFLRQEYSAWQKIEPLQEEQNEH